MTRLLDRWCPIRVRGSPFDSFSSTSPRPLSARDPRCGDRGRVVLRDGSQMEVRLFDGTPPFVGVGEGVPVRVGRKGSGLGFGLYEWASGNYGYRGNLGPFGRSGTYTLFSHGIRSVLLGGGTAREGARFVGVSRGPGGANPPSCTGPAPPEPRVGSSYRKGTRDARVDIARLRPLSTQGRRTRPGQT